MWQRQAENSEKGTEDRWELEGKKTGTYFEILIPPQPFYLLFLIGGLDGLD